MDESTECPLAQSDDKFAEAHYFLGKMMDDYHDPAPFRYNLNAFLQALRSVTFVLQKDLAHRDGFQDWYPERQERMMEDPLLRKFVTGRNIVVKQRNLEMNSKAEIGFFRGRRLKLAFGLEVPTYVPSKHLVDNVAPKSGLIDPQHSAIDEQYGVRREWIAPELGDDNVLTLCDLAWVKIGQVLSEAHEFAGWHSLPPVEHGHAPEACDVLLESDLDPNLPKEWGWVD